MNQLFKLFLWWAGLAVMVFLVATFFFSSDEYDKFITRGIKVEVVVEQKHPDNHQNITYSYIVDGNQYTGIGPTDHGNPSFANIKIGQKIAAYYDSTDPQKSIPGDPKFYGKGNSGGIYFLSIFAPFLIVFGLLKKGWI
jgi:hypothetical protein